MATSQPEKKNRLSRLLGKRDKSPAEPTAPPDSAYASSETPSAEPSKAERSTSDFVTAEKGSDIANIDKDRNLALKPSTGEVRDEDTGEIVTVVTTTTTTTTTTTRKPGGNALPTVQKDVKRDVQETTQPTLSSPSTQPTPFMQQTGPAEMPANTTRPQQGTPVAPQSTVPDPTSSRPVSGLSAPSIPHKSLARKSGEYGTSAQAGPVQENLSVEPPLSPTGRHNFSYPSRNRNSMEPDGVSLMTIDQPQSHNRGTMSDLRAAAKGIHGVGETLRGTLNSTIDNNFQRKDPAKAAAVRAKNDAILERGRREMEGIPTRPENHRTKTSDQSIPGQWDEHEYEQENLHPTTSPGAYGGSGEKELAANAEGRKARSIGKLFKRKPVGSEKGELRVRNP